MTSLAIAALTAALMPAGHAAAGSDAGRMAAARSVQPSADVALIVAGVARVEDGWFAGAQARTSGVYADRLCSIDLRARM
jgi:hypothetical protein